MPLFIALGVFLIVLISVSLYGHRIYVRPARVYQQLSEENTVSTAKKKGLTSSLASWIGRMGRYLPFDVERASQVRQQLAAAGFRSENSVFLVSGVRVLLLAGAVAGTLSLPVQGRYRGCLILGAALVAYRVPEFCLKFFVSRRQEQLGVALPDALDLVVVCAEAGLGLDQALRNVTREIRTLHPALAEEFSLTALEMTAGVRRGDALRNLAARTGQVEIRKFTAVLIQADRFGTSLAESLRMHAEYLRMRRTQLAEERAGKVGVKLVFPIFFCILPSLLLVAAGPAIIAIANTLLPALEGMGQ